MARALMTTVSEISLSGAGGPAGIGNIFSTENQIGGGDILQKDWYDLVGIGHTSLGLANVRWVR
eukprot:4039112-Pyramimonas_sp.AAC.1